MATLSTTEAEYVALGDGVKEALFAKAVASFLVPGLTEKIILAIADNEGAINLASNPLSYARTKHIVFVIAAVVSTELRRTSDWTI